MYLLYFVNFQYGSSDRFETVAEAIEGARKAGFEALIYCETDWEPVGSWSILDGFRAF